jgi:hypothetical protein
VPHIVFFSPFGGRNYTFLPFWGGIFPVFPHTSMHLVAQTTFAHLGMIENGGLFFFAHTSMPNMASYEALSHPLGGGKCRWGFLPRLGGGKSPQNHDFPQTSPIK